MTNSKSVVEEIQEIIDVWCPEQFKSEAPTMRMLRALMDQQRALQGQESIRELSTYPIYLKSKTK
jgi:hypothetical protein